MRKMDPASLSDRGRSFFKMIEFDPDETLIGEIRKHPFGLFIIFLTGGLVAFSVLFALIVLPLFIVEDRIGSGIDVGSLRAVLAALGLLLTVLTVAMTAIGAYLYQSNIVIVTSEKVTQLLYKTIFDRKISQLSIGDVQDVTVTQKGIFARIFNYGTLVIETAGEQQNYNFSYTPNPYQTAKLIVGAHEENLKLYGN